MLKGMKSKKAKIANINWEDPYLNRWISSIRKDGTKSVYQSGFALYADFTKLSPKQMIDEAIEDQRKDVLERKNIAKSRLLDFNKWLLTKAVNQKRKDEHGNPKLGLSEKISNTYVQAIRSFYSEFDITIKFKGRSRLPTPRVENERLKLEPEQVKKLIDYTTSPRDRAVILTMFQGGMDDSTLCSIKYKQVKKAVISESYKQPHKIELFRNKAEVDHYTFLGKDAVEAIQAYVQYLKNNDGITLSDDDPLFIVQVYQKNEMKQIKGIEAKHIQAILRETAVRAGFVTREQLKQTCHNPVNPHSLRESWSKILFNNGVDKLKIDFMMGHTINEQDKVYFENQDEKLKQLYASVEKYISISVSSSTASKVEEDVATLKQTVETMAIQHGDDIETIKELLRGILLVKGNKVEYDPLAYKESPYYRKAVALYTELTNKTVKPTK